MIKPTRKPRGNLKELIERTKNEAEQKIRRYEEKLKEIETKEEKPKKKKGKPEPVRPVAPKLIGAPVPSEKDVMIELKWKGLI